MCDFSPSKIACFHKNSLYFTSTLPLMGYMPLHCYSQIVQRLLWHRIGGTVMLWLFIVQETIGWNVDYLFCY